MRIQDYQNRLAQDLERLRSTLDLEETTDFETEPAALDTSYRI